MASEARGIEHLGATISARFRFMVCLFDFVIPEIRAGCSGLPSTTISAPFFLLAHRTVSMGFSGGLVVFLPYHVWLFCHLYIVYLCDSLSFYLSLLSLCRVLFVNVPASVCVFSVFFVAIHLTFLYFLDLVFYLRVLCSIMFVF